MAECFRPRHILATLVPVWWVSVDKEQGGLLQKERVSGQVSSAWQCMLTCFSHHVFTFSSILSSHFWHEHVRNLKLFRKAWFWTKSSQPLIAFCGEQRAHIYTRHFTHFQHIIIGIFEIVGKKAHLWKSKRALATDCDNKGWSVMIKLFFLCSFVALARGASSPVVQLTEETWTQVHFYLLYYTQ